ncbi:NADH:flavin oxidoreductase/NADH oxidase [Nocardiopsis ansamitocini]|uniref:NADH:flavin oxidoreductase/NADH oxidase n=1 Tax=Nocardiopsis ansamitocini TaxID=1670832 RepID=UPI0025535D7B|nr:NADH:flavin oxidoreductase/NADH oxidase [Nocardiopsis ansamitocini]
MSTLFQPMTLRSLTVPNRVWLSPMCMYSAAATGPDAASPTDWHLAHLVSRAVGGAGLVMTEATAVTAEGRISPFDLGIYNDRQQQAFTRVAAAITAAGAVPAIQLAHAGPKASTDRPWRGGGTVAVADDGWTPVGPVAVPFGDHVTPRALDRDEIAGLVGAFARAAERARDAGFQVAEVHGAHGYLIHSFLSPYTNQRTDDYGGSFANRARFALEVVEAVRAVWPEELPVLFRVSATDWLSENPADPREGWTGDDTVLLAKELQARGVDLLDVSSGGAAPDARIEAAPGFQVPFATRVRQEAGLPVAAVGLITEPAQAERIVAEGDADAVLLARAMLRDPYWPQRAARELGAAVPAPVQYGRA